MRTRYARNGTRSASPAMLSLLFTLVFITVTLMAMIIFAIDYADDA